MYLLSQMLIYLLIAALIGGLIARVLGLCNCKSTEEVDALTRERDDLAARLAAGAAGAAGGAALAASAGRDAARVAALEAELAEVRVRADGLAGELAKARAEAPAAAPAVEDEAASAMKWRNRYLEARVKYLESNAAAPVAAPVAAALAGAGAAALAVDASAQAAPAVAAAPATRAKPATKPKVAAKPKTGKAGASEAGEPTNDTFTSSPLGLLSADELEARVDAAGAGRKPRASRRRVGADDLLLIDGVGPKNNAWLNENGIRHFWQIAVMDVEEVAWLRANLPTFGSRVVRENWVAQCINLARGKDPKSPL